MAQLKIQRCKVCTSPLPVGIAKCPKCGAREFEKVDIFEFKWIPRKKEYLKVKVKELNRCLNCKHDVEKSQVK